MIVVLLLQLFFLPAAAGMVGAPFGGTAADRAIGNTFSGNGMGNQRRVHGQWRQRSQDNHPVENDEHDCRYEAGESAHQVFLLLLGAVNTAQHNY